MPVPTLPPPLRPRISLPLDQFTSDPALAFGLVAAVGSPVNVIDPSLIATNADRFAATMRARGLQHRVFFAHKANRSPAFVRELAASDHDIDVASLAELQGALASGFVPARIQVTGPKSDELLWLCARTGVCVNLDSLGEARRLHAIVEAASLPSVPVLMRLSEFTNLPTLKGLRRHSRFGEPSGELDHLLDFFETLPTLRLRGFSFHLDTVSVEEKAAAVAVCLEALAACQERGIGADVIDIGGGYGASYVEHRDDWDTWTSALVDDVMAQGPAMTWGSHGYGYHQSSGVLRGTLSLYPAHRPRTGPDYLADILDSTLPCGDTIASAIQDHLYELWIEPGRSLVEDAGWVVGRVEDVRDKDGRLLVHLALNARDVSLEEHGVVVDPLLIPRQPRPDEPVGAFLLGNLCLEADLITRRLVRLPARPHPGDLLVFANTAGYFMDFSADQALQQPLATTVAWTPDGDHPWCLDTHYWPVPGKTLS